MNAWRKILRSHLVLTKPGIIMGNVITTICGFAIASQNSFDLRLFIATLLGLSCIIGSACVFNNYMDREMDAKMARTRNRALAKGSVSARGAIAFAAALGLLGTYILAHFTNILTAAIALTGFFIYVILYGIAKYKTSLATLIGSIAGATPPLVGYCAVSDRLDTGALLLFLLIVVWQMPHFYAIALYRFDDYLAASIPVLPVKKGMQATKVQMLLYVLAFIPAALLPTLFGYTGYASLAIGALLGLAWLTLCIKGFNGGDHKLWARKMFRFSLVVVTVLCLALSLDVKAPLS